MTEPPADTQTETQHTDTNATQSTDRTIALGTRRLDYATLLAVCGLAWIVLVGWWVDGITGITVGLGIAGVAIVAQPTVVVAIAHAGLLLLVPELTTLTTLIELGLFELGVLAVLFSYRPVEILTVVLTVGFGSVFVATLIAALIWADVVVASVLLVGGVAVLGYGIHRYERVSLGLVDDESETTDPSVS